MSEIPVAPGVAVTPDHPLYPTIRAAVLAEREACAQVVADLAEAKRLAAPIVGCDVLLAEATELGELAAAIRARGEE